MDDETKKVKTWTLPDRSAVGLYALGPGRFRVHEEDGRAIGTVYRGSLRRFWFEDGNDEPFDDLGEAIEAVVRRSRGGARSAEADGVLRLAVAFNTATERLDRIRAIVRKDPRLVSTPRGNDVILKVIGRHVRAARRFTLAVRSFYEASPREAEELRDGIKGYAGALALATCVVADTRTERARDRAARGTLR